MHSVADEMPCALWIWGLQELRQVALIVSLTPISKVYWNPCKNSCVILTLEPECGLLFWSLECGIVVSEVPLRPVSFEWAANGEGFIVGDRDKMSIGYVL